MSWRPDNWEELRAGNCETLNPACECAECMSFEAGADAMLEALKSELSAYPIFLKNCRSNRIRNCKICLDCPFRVAGIL